MEAGYSTRPMGWHIWLQKVDRMRVDDELRKSVVFIGQIGPNGFIPVGTGFVVSADTMGMRFDHVVTARHNLEMIQGETVYIRVNKIGGGADTVQTKRSEWRFIKDRKGGRYIDVAVLPTRGVAIDGSKLDVRPIPDPLILPSEDEASRMDLMAGAPVVTIGLFTSHYGEAHNIPIVRQGNIATMRDPANMVSTTRGYMDAYLVELRSLGGLSGSPVFLLIEPYWLTERKKPRKI